MSDAPAIELRDASCRTGDRLRLHPTSLRVERGTITAVIGRNGSGKSTMLGLMSSEIRPSEGIVLLNGDDVEGLSLTERARRRAVLTQDTSVSFPFSVRDVVSWGRTPWQRTPRAAEDDAVIDEAIASQDLAALVDRPVTSLSGGERKRVHIARVLAQQSHVLLLDEADADLDLVGRRVVDDLVVEHCGRGDTAIVVSHDISRLARICDQFILMREGRVHLMGTPAEVLTEQHLSEAFGATVAVTGEGDALTVHIP
jgi:iron complex transport system ATP-binding protein